MINLQTELDRIHALEWDKQQGELEALAVRLAEERDYVLLHGCAKFDTQQKQLDRQQILCYPTDRNGGSDNESS